MGWVEREGTNLGRPGYWGNFKPTMLGVPFQGLSSPPASVPILHAEKPDQTDSWQFSLVSKQLTNSTHHQRKEGRQSGQRKQYLLLWQEEPLGNWGHPSSLLVLPLEPTGPSSFRQRVGSDPALSWRFTVEVLRAQQDRLTGGEVTQPQSTLGNLLCVGPRPHTGGLGQSTSSALSAVHGTGLIKACVSQEKRDPVISRCPPQPRRVLPRMIRLCAAGRHLF